MKDSKGNVVKVGTELRSTQSSDDKPTISCIAINGDVATMRYKILRTVEQEFKIDKKNLLNSLLVVCN